jgi:hypothetical protein
MQKSIGSIPRLRVRAARPSDSRRRSSREARPQSVQAIRGQATHVAIARRVALPALEAHPSSRSEVEQFAVRS